MIAAGTMVRRRKDGARMLLHFLAELSPKPTSGGDGKPPVAALDGAAERKLKLRMTVNIGEGRQGEIKVCEGDDPADLAALFCKIHALKSARVLKKIESHITDNLANLPTTPTAAPAAAPAEAK